MEKDLAILMADLSGYTAMTDAHGGASAARTAQILNSLTLEERHFLSIHAGLHYGPIFIENENLFGSTINVAARIMNLASRGQVLCSSSIQDDAN